jgi:hypothetical protein
MSVLREVLAGAADELPRGVFGRIDDFGDA